MTIDVIEKLTLEQYVRRGIRLEKDLDDEGCHKAVATALARDMREDFGQTKEEFLELCAKAWGAYVEEATSDG